MRGRRGRGQDGGPTSGRRHRLRAVAVGTALAGAAAVLTSCEVGSTLARADAPQVLTGAQLPTLVGTPPGQIVAFAHLSVDGVPTWRQIPVQVDERKVVPYGSQPSNNTTPGTMGTVYGSGTGGPVALQYADPSTFVGADADTGFDADDELVFMSGDAGGDPAPGDPAEPAGVVPGSGTRVRLTDPLAPDTGATVYLFRSAGGLVPGAGADYVDYDFVLDSGDYRTTYRRRTGPNPEHSRARTAAYEIEYPERWFETSWRMLGGTASGADILDAQKNQFAIGVCGRSNLTFASEEGAFVANIDGPVRGIRSYVGANSGPYTQRTHLMYRGSEVVVTDLRVHAIPGIMDFVDYSPAALGMTYHSQTVPGGVTIDGAPDGVGTGLTEWEAVTGAPGTVFMTSNYQTTLNPPGGFETMLDWFHRDQTSPPETQCFGDGSLLGASGPSVVAGIDNTDPAAEANPDLFRGIRTYTFTPPVAAGDVAAIGDLHGAQADAPLTVSVTAP